MTSSIIFFGFCLIPIYKNKSILIITPNSLFINFRLTIKMKLSSKSIEFTQNKAKDFLTITNSTNNRIIYKVKTNFTEAFLIYPSRGFIGPQQKLEMQISMRTYMHQKGKMMIIYAEIKENSETNFQQAWKSIQNNAFINEMIEILYTSVKQKEEIKQKAFKKTESPIHQPQFQRSTNGNSLQSNQSNLQKRETFQSVIVHKNTIMLQKTLKDIRKSKQEQQSHMIDSKKLEKNKAFESQLRKEREQTKKLRQKLLQKDRKLRYYEQLVQKDINNSIKPEQQQQFKLNNLNLCLLILVCIFFGFFVAKINFKETDI